MNMEQLSAQMKGAKTRLIKQVEAELGAAALEMEARSKDKNFSDFNNDTGRLRQSIAGSYGTVGNLPSAILQAGGQFGGKELRYAEYIEFGTSRIRPRRFLGRSVEAQQKDLKPRLQSLLKIAVGMK